MTDPYQRSRAHSKFHFFSKCCVVSEAENRRADLAINRGADFSSIRGNLDIADQLVEANNELHTLRGHLTSVTSLYNELKEKFEKGQ